MIAENSRSQKSPEQSRARREEWIERFETAWHAGQRPVLEDYLPPIGPDRQAVLIELVHAELELRLKAGEPARAEDYLKRFPELAADSAVVSSLIAAEKAFRAEDVVLSTVPPTARPANPSDSPTTNNRKFSVPERVMAPGYELLGELGRGGMGVVYKARQVRLQRLVALKVILAGDHAGGDALSRFRTEAEAVARVQHPHVVQIYEVGEHEGKPYLCLEYCAGGSLQQKLDGTPFPHEEAAGLVQTLARAIHAAHEKNVIHRDLKPANVLLAEDGEPKITDFGLAKRTDEAGRTGSGEVMGTPSYMAPEQAGGKGREVGPGTDVYALGAILYQLLTGRPPFKAATPLDTLVQVLNDEPAPPRQLQSKTPRDLETICLKCLEKDPAKRYGTAEALADDLRRFLNGEPIHARPASTAERLWKWVWRKPAAAALVGVTFLAAFALMAAVALFGLYESQQAGIYKQELEVRKRSSQTLLRAQQHEEAGRWTEAHTELARAQEVLDAQLDLRADELRSEVRRRLALVEEQLRQQEQRQQAEKRRQAFQPFHDDALFYETLFTGLSVPENQARTRTAARTALAVYGLEAESKTAEQETALLEHDRPHLGAAEHARLAGACYELLLIWAETEAAGPPGKVETREQELQRINTALALLHRAKRLGKVYTLHTWTLPFREARYLARSKGEPFDPAPFVRKGSARPPGSLDWFLTALERYRAGRYEQAGEACREVLRQEGKHFWARYVQALCHLRAGRWVEGRAELTVCMSQRPAFAWPRLLRGFAASELGHTHPRPEQAAVEYRAAEEDFAAAMKQDREPLLQYVGLANRGVLNIHRRRWPEAVRDLQRAVKVNPGGFQGYVNLAQALQGEEKWEEAAATLDQAVKRFPGLAVLHESRARLHLRRKQWTAAQTDFEQAVALDLAGGQVSERSAGNPDRLANNLVELGRLLHRQGEYQSALARFDQAIKLAPRLILIQRFRARTLLALNREAEAGQALDRYLAAVREAPAEVYVRRGRIYAEMKQWPAAIDMYTLALRQDPREETRCFRGWAYLRTDAARLALEDFDACLRQTPTNADALAGRGNARIRLKKLQDALEDARKAESHGPLTYGLWYNLACIYARVVEQLRGDVRTGSPALAESASRRVRQYEEKAVDSLRRCLEALPEDRRAGFWRTQILTDPALSSVRQGKKFFQLAGKYGKP